MGPSSPSRTVGHDKGTNFRALGLERVVIKCLSHVTCSCFTSLMSCTVEEGNIFVQNGDNHLLDCTVS